MTYTLSPLIRAYLRSRTGTRAITRKTAINYRRQLDGLAESFGHRPLSQFGTAAIERWLEPISLLSPATGRTYLSTCRGFCKWLVREGKVRRDPTLDIDPIRQPRSVPRNLDEGDVASLLEVLPDARARAVVWLMVGCGLRCKEVAELGIGSYDRDALLLRRVRGKGGHERDVPVPHEVAGPLNAYLATIRATAGPLIRSHAHPTRGVAPKYLSELVSGWMREAGFKTGAYDGISAHALRHTAATDVFDRSLDLGAVQAMLGHANIATTSRYLGPRSNDTVRAAMEGRSYGSGRGRDNGTRLAA